MSDRFKDLSPSEQRLATMRRDGYLPEEPAEMKPRRKPRYSNDLSLEDFVRGYESIATANLAGKVLNVFVTISWGVAGITNESYIGHLQDRFLESQKSHFAHLRKGGIDAPLMVVWVKEVGKRLGLHTHLLLHVPPSHFTKYRDWARRAAHNIAEMARPDPRRPAPAQRLVHVEWLNDDPNNQWNVFRYLMKGLDTDAIFFLRDRGYFDLLSKEFDRQLVPQGRVEGARIGRSRSLGPEALKAVYAEIGYQRIGVNEYDQYPYGRHYLDSGNLTRQLKAIDI